MNFAPSHWPLLFLTLLVIHFPKSAETSPIPDLPKGRYTPHVSTLVENYKPIVHPPTNYSPGFASTPKVQSPKLNSFVHPTALDSPTTGRAPQGATLRKSNIRTVSSSAASTSPATPRRPEAPTKPEGPAKPQVPDKPDIPHFNDLSNAKLPVTPSIDSLFLLRDFGGGGSVRDNVACACIGAFTPFLLDSYTSIMSFQLPPCI
ncbi:hypothetical protein BJ684DRAFT_15024 [Piptocephalis cylindrospora]|uniref:Uncharacterized protein n=1 Tax=Piptocephalis cylindrospora TaxID=1907219 RepID=A0A4P9Y7F5_9FUNG|nr:hypothetical protein BJ684DRAFT_15024 [Piptocephalis cylindrospora]|eukprot:RKP14664.1 hypothetical protein BJ684DRAFT_15024 [Piptocephalis cylindrospora]